MAGIYIHIPFCKKLCHYCDFYKCLDTGLIDKYLKTLKKEAILQQDYLQDQKIETLYFGGGTPSVLSSVQLGWLKDQIYEIFKLDEMAELTIELNPDDVGLIFYRDLIKVGFNRISLGVQSWDDDILKFLNRRHKAKQSEKAIIEARETGFSNISVDLIYGIPGFDQESWEQSLTKTFSMEIEHLSAYHLTIEDGTMFGRMKNNGDLKEIDEQESEKQFSSLLRLSEEHGFMQYEISNFCKEERYSKHNTNYWKQIPYLGLGPSAHSFNGNSRKWNVSDINDYIKNIEEGRVPCKEEWLDDKTIYNEYVMTSLRTVWGVDLEEVEIIFDKEARDYLFNLAGRFIKYGMLEMKTKNHLVLTNQGKLISDNIISELMMI